MVRYGGHINPKRERGKITPVFNSKIEETGNAC